MDVEEEIKGYDLTGKPKKSLLRAWGFLSGYCHADDLKEIHLGGGTALAMRWQHRESVDIDFSMPMDVLNRLVHINKGDMENALYRLVDAGEIKKHFRVFERGTYWTYVDSGPVSVSVARLRKNDTPLSWERDTGVSLSNTYNILKGKLQGRVLDSGKLLLRDGYDLSCAFLKAPAIMNALIEEMMNFREDGLKDIVRHIKTSPNRIHIGRPLVAPTHHEIAHDPWGWFAKRLDQIMVARNQEKQ